MFFKFGLKFFKIFFMQYFKLMLKPIAIGILGCVPIFLTLITSNPFFAILSLIISIPCTCYGFWRGFVITYSLNIASYYFIKNNNSSITLEDCYKIALKQEKDFAFYVVFTGVATILLYIPTLIMFFTKISSADVAFLLSNPLDINDIVTPVMKATILNTLIAMPFLNYATQAYFFKKDENYVQLLLNCYKKLNFTGFLIAFIITAGSSFISSILPVVYLFVFMQINVLVYSINTSWYYSRIFSLKK